MLSEDNTKRTLPKTDEAAELLKNDTQSESVNMKSKMVSETESTDVLRQTVLESESDDLAQHDSAGTTVNTRYFGLRII